MGWGKQLLLKLQLYSHNITIYKYVLKLNLNLNSKIILETINEGEIHGGKYFK